MPTVADQICGVWDVGVPTGGYTNNAFNYNNISAGAFERVDNLLYSGSRMFERLFKTPTGLEERLAGCGYPEDKELSGDFFKKLYDRDPIASRVVNVMPEETWQARPCVYEDADERVTTPFKADMEAIGKRLNGGSFYEGDDSNPLWGYCERVDKLSRIGYYGAIFIGYDDKQPDLSRPLTINDNPTGPGDPSKLLYLRVMDESTARVTQLEPNPNDPRFGQPLMYLVTFNDPKVGSQALIGASQITKEVHWTRIVHIVADLESSEIYSVPVLKQVLNTIYNLRKLYGGSAEMYWRGAFPGLSVESLPSFAGIKPTDADKKSWRASMQQYDQGLQRWLAFTGMTVKSLAPQVVDPTPQIDVQMEAICINKAIPKRVFTGSERGELASAQDDKRWSSRLVKHRNTNTTPHIIVPLIDRFIRLGIATAPKQFYVSWEEESTLTDQENATIVGLQTTAMAAYVIGGVESLVPEQYYLQDFLHIDKKRAEEYLEEAQSKMEELQTQYEDQGIPTGPDGQPIPSNLLPQQDDADTTPVGAAT